MLPETKKLTLEEMNRLFTEAPFFIGSRNKAIRERCAVGGVEMLERDVKEPMDDARAHTEYTNDI
jgi:hypothetical protein